MSDAAKVTSVDALKDFREGLAAFLEDARNALVAVQMENRRASDWLHNHQRLYWNEELKRRRERHSMALTELHRVKLQAKPGSAVKDTDQKDAVRMTLAKVREAEEKVEIVKRWGPPLQHAIDEYVGKARALDDLLGGDVVHSLALLERMITSLEEYLRLTAPPTT
jgi:hypothetical protein